MTGARPLQVVLEELAGGGGGQADLAADPAGVLAASGHGDLPDSLVAEAIVCYADTAPVEVAAHLAPFVQAHSPVPLAGPGEPVADLATGLALLASAPTVADSPDDDPMIAPSPVASDGAPGLAADEFGTGDGAGINDPPEPGGSVADPFAWDFGGGDQAGPPATSLDEEWDELRWEDPVPPYGEPPDPEPAADVRGFPAESTDDPGPDDPAPSDPAGLG